MSYKSIKSYEPIPGFSLIKLSVTSQLSGVWGVLGVLHTPKTPHFPPSFEKLQLSIIIITSSIIDLALQICIAGA